MHGNRAATEQICSTDMRRCYLYTCHKTRTALGKAVPILAVGHGSGFLTKESDNRASIFCENVINSAL